MAAEHRLVDHRLWALGTAVALVPLLSLDLVGIAGEGTKNLSVCIQQLSEGGVQSHAAGVALLFHGVALGFAGGALGLFIQHVAVNSGAKLKDRMDGQLVLDYRDPGEIGHEPAGLWKGEPEPPLVPPGPATLDRLVDVKSRLAEHWDEKNLSRRGRT